MADVRYENVPVFRVAGNYDPDNLIGRATVEVDEKAHKATITIEALGEFVDFVLMGDLKGLSLSGFVSGVDAEKAKEYWSRQR